jgi:hypothetical protein
MITNEGFDPSRLLCYSLTDYYYDIPSSFEFQDCEFPYGLLLLHYRKMKENEPSCDSLRLLYYLNYLSNTIYRCDSLTDYYDYYPCKFTQLMCCDSPRITMITTQLLLTSSSSVVIPLRLWLLPAEVERLGWGPLWFPYGLLWLLPSIFASFCIRLWFPYGFTMTQNRTEKLNCCDSLRITMITTQYHFYLLKQCCDSLTDYLITTPLVMLNSLIKYLFYQIKWLFLSLLTITSFF